MQAGALSVSAVMAFLREVLESSEIFGDLWVVGEVSNFTRSQLGHRYFSLRDNSAVLKAVLFRSDMPGMTLQDGDRVLVHGRLSVYPQRGDLQLVADFVRPEGMGILQARFEELRERLATEGLFAPERKRPLPRFPERVGVVTSPRGAALQDIRDVLGRRWPLAEVLVAPALVQGDYAAGQLVAALRQLSLEPALDVVIIARGGGSSEDLHAFNDERVARAIFGFPAPVVSGVGHETDLTIADMVADRRAPTPSSAAEIATPDIREVARGIEVLSRMMASAAREGIAGNAGRVEGALLRLERAAPDLAVLAHNVRGLLAEVEAGLTRRCGIDRARYEQLNGRLAGLDPMATLGRGYAIVQKATGRRVVNSVRKVKPGEPLRIAVRDGTFWTQVG